MHQPYLFPYRGYFDLIASVDRFVVYDDAKYMKGKYINRNFFPELFTFRLQKHSDYATIGDCYFLDLFEDIKKFKRRFGDIGDKYFKLMSPTYSLSFNIALTIQAICRDLGINTEIYFSSTIPHGKSVSGVLDVVRSLSGDTYVNAPGGKDLYNQEMFGDIKLEFIETQKGPSILCEL